MEEQTKDHFWLVALGWLDDSAAFEPSGEFSCEQREGWDGAVFEEAKRGNVFLSGLRGVGHWRYGRLLASAALI